MKTEKFWKDAEDKPVPVDDPRRVGVYRSMDDAWLGGVFAGFAHKWGLNRLGLRVAAVLVALFSTVFSVFIVAVYIILWMVLPQRNTKPDSFEFE